MALGPVRPPRKTKLEIAMIWLDILGDLYISEGLCIPLEKVKELRAIKDKEEADAKTKETP